MCLLYVNFRRIQNRVSKNHLRKFIYGTVYLMQWLGTCFWVKIENALK